MSTETGSTASAMLSPDDAFAVLGNEVRIQILQTLGTANGPLSFTTIRDRVGLEQGQQFNYHLDKLTGHFVEKTEEGYSLCRPGERVIEAVVSGAVTESPVLERTQIKEVCQLCGAPIEVRFEEGRLETFCTDCEGFGHPGTSLSEGYLGAKFLPPAGIRGRTPIEVLETAWTWTNLEIFAVASDICPRCSALLDPSVSICETHEVTDEWCSDCGRRQAVRFRSACRNCTFEVAGSIAIYLATNTELLAFLTTHGLNPISPDNTSAVQAVYSNYTEAVRSVDPFEGAFTFTVGDEALTLTVDDDLSVVSVSRHPATEAP